MNDTANFETWILAGDLSAGDIVVTAEWPVRTVVVDRVVPANDGGSPSDLLIFTSGETIRAKSCELVLTRPKPN